MTKKKKQILQLGLGILVSAAALYVVLQGVTWQDLVAAFRSFRLSALWPCLFWFYAGILVRGWRWQLLFRPAHRIPFWHATGGMFICFAFNSLFPARAGEFARAYLIGKKDNTGFSTALGTVVAERLLDMLVLLPCLILALAVAPIASDAEFSLTLFGKPWTLTGAQFLKTKDGILMMAILLGIGIAAISLERSRGWFLQILHALRFIPEGIRKKIEYLINEFAQGLRSLYHPGRAVVLLTLSVITWVTNALSVQALAGGFDFQHSMTFLQAFALIIIACIFIAVPATPGYWGLLEAGFVFSIVIMGIHPNDPLVVSFAILAHLSQWLPLILIGMPWAWFWHVSMDEVEAAEEEAKQ
ncbi:MAG TPA: lysylphosphatidylglycerol synthase transmembrane domain-containing protein [Candidatus Sumerlaeota bacterium]|nr:lysylphosphatidylglycerol synthase transmembrane domain-containing protein [Candidatus Sumerlaeota bacterium]HPS01577.1 lysylphosphatidylglycerol synthase transmembrane domain-containing protein [Candidatus Sumerlaeota bacterium]